MNNSKEVLCRIIADIKKERGYTLSDIKTIYMEKEGNKLTDAQLNKVLNHNGNGVSIELIDTLIYELGYEIDYIVRGHYFED